MSSLKDKRSRKTEAADPGAVAGPAEVLVGRVVGVGQDGAPLVDFADNPAGVPIRALATARYDDVVCGASVALMFVEGDRARPLAIGVVSQSQAEPTSVPEDRLTFTAAREIVLQCGRASLVLTRAGKVLVRGAYVSLRSSGVQRITGASVQIN
jgi:Domain of unknown function (DUF6484)